MKYACADVEERNILEEIHMDQKYRRELSRKRKAEDRSHRNAKKNTVSQKLRQQKLDEIRFRELSCEY